MEVISERFHVVADLDADTARRIATHLELTADTLESLGFYVRQPELPVSVIVFDGEEEFGAYRVGTDARAFAAYSEDRLYIAIAWNAPGDPWQALSHEWAHLTTDFKALPPWFREGLADHLSLARGDGLEPVTPTNLVNALLSKYWLPIDQLLRAGDEDAARRHEQFYPQSWLAVSWLAETEGLPVREITPYMLQGRLLASGMHELEVQLRAYASELQLRAASSRSARRA